MRFVNLKIERKEAYDSEYPNQLVGLVQLAGENGKQEVKLSSPTVSRIFELIKSDCQRVANQNAAETGEAIEEAAAEPLLLDQTKFIEA
jgi:hypothetical protein